MNKAENQNVKKILEEAAEAVDGLPPELKVKAFELAFNQLISSNKEAGDDTREAISISSKPGDFFAKMQNETGIQESDLKSVFRLDKNNDIKIIAPLNGTNAEKQRVLAYLYIFALRVGFNSEWVSALKFAQQTSEYGINDTHVSKNLKQDKINIRHAGRKRGKEYSLTPNGVIKAKEVLNKFING